MDFRYIYTRLNVANFQDCKAFYKDVLNLPFVFEDAQDEYIEFRTGTTSITLYNRAKLSEFVGTHEPLTYDGHSGAVALTFHVNNIDDAIAYLQSKGVTMITQPITYPDRGFIAATFRDPEGVLIEVEQMTDVVIG